MPAAGSSSSSRLGFVASARTNLQAALRAVGQRACLGVGEILHVEDGQQLHRALVGDALFASSKPGRRKMPSSMRVVHLRCACATRDVVLHAQLAETGGCSGTCGRCPARLTCAVFMPCGVFAVEQDGAVGGLIDLGEQVEDRRLAGAVRADEAGDLGAADGHVEVVDRFQTAERRCRGRCTRARGTCPASRSVSSAGSRETGTSLAFSCLCHAVTSSFFSTGCGDGAEVSGRTPCDLRTVGREHDEDQHDRVDEHTVSRQSRRSASGRTVSTAAAMMRAPDVAEAAEHHEHEDEDGGVEVELAAPDGGE